MQCSRSRNRTRSSWGSLMHKGIGLPIAWEAQWHSFPWRPFETVLQGIVFFPTFLIQTLSTWTVATTSCPQYFIYPKVCHSFRSHPTSLYCSWSQNCASHGVFLIKLVCIHPPTWVDSSDSLHITSMVYPLAVCSVKVLYHDGNGWWYIILSEISFLYHCPLCIFWMHTSIQMCFLK